MKKTPYRSWVRFLAGWASITPATVEIVPHVEVDIGSIFSDGQAIKNDWMMIGSDIRWGMEQFEKKTLVTHQRNLFDAK